MMAGGVTAQIAFAIYPPLLDELARVTKGALARDDASEACILFCSLLF
jgi:hypothetical protein